jgi:hypothetical protein
MKLKTDSKIVIWFTSCALLAVFIQGMADRFEFARLRSSPKKSFVRPVRARRTRRELEVAYH